MKKKKDFFIALVPAKKNSSELKNKNFLRLNNIPLYQISLIASLNSKYIQSIYISSDSEEILNESKKIGIETILRPKKISSNIALADDVVKHFIKILKKKKIFNQNINIIYLQPTSPFRNHLHINKAISLYIKKNYKSLLSVCVSKKPIQKSLLIKKNKIFSFFEEKESNFHTANRQNLKKTFFPNGAIYIFKVKDFLKNNKIPIFNSIPFEMDDVSSIDIDNNFDYEVAKLLSDKHIIYKK